jgi:hypothetical protein
LGSEAFEDDLATGPATFEQGMGAIEVGRVGVADRKYSLKRHPPG